VNTAANSLKARQRRVPPDNDRRPAPPCSPHRRR
jgi:hypothetical protein